ncbi:DMT family transporter [Rossellomorea vietnamensis]|uniref:DMT family transporter n=1 Tax=Rossellomorea vietnamensis TaxID=218284 RepID=UPI001CCBBE6E|nr:DMT family transporter [Rossellomorea vietnamensis]MCA0149271.1 DMT family transporter [Rossellomorea vietnamensis]
MKKWQTYIILVFIMLIWGFNVPALKTLVSEFTPVTITSLRIFTAGVTVFILLGLMGKIRKPTGKEFLFIIAGGLLNVVSHHYFLSVGLTGTSSTNGGLILGTGPLLTALMATIILRNRPTVIKIIGFLSGSVGVTIIVLSGGEGIGGLKMGDLFIFISIFSQALSFIIISRAAKTLDPRLLTGYMLVFGSVVLFVISLITEPGGLKQLGDAPVAIWVLFFASAILATAIGHMIYNHSIGKIGAAETSIFLNLNTFFSLLGAAVFLGETVTFYHLFGLVFIVLGVVCGSGTLEEFVVRRKQKRFLEGKQHHHM